MASLKKLVNETCGNDLYFLSCTHHGLHEESALREFNPYLDLNELITFAAESWIKRDRQFNEFEKVVNNSNLYEIFSWTYKNGGMGLLNNRKNISSESLNLYKKNNPYNGEVLEERLRLVPVEYESKLRQELTKNVLTYCRNEDDYYAKKAKQKGDNSNLVILPFNRKYIKKTQMPDEFSRLIAAKIKNFPLDMHYDS